MPIDRVEEVTARQIVAEHLGVPVLRYDDGSAPSMVDALIRSPRGDFPLETISDHEVPYVRQSAALEKYGQFLLVDGIRGSWHVTLTRMARIRDLHNFLPGLLVSLDGSLPETLDREHVPSELRALGIRRLSRMASEPAGWNVIFSQGGWNGSVGMDDLGEWASAVLGAQVDVASKLGRHGGEERHAFLWATIGSSYGAQFALGESWLPVRPPILPPEVTHLWTAGMMSSQGCLRWSPAGGWERTTWKWASTT